jgi:hypothetical protein
MLIQNIEEGPFIEDVKDVEAGACFLPAKFWTSSPHGEVVQSEEEED